MKQLENKFGSRNFILPTAQPSDDIEIKNAQVYASSSSQKNKEIYGLHTNWWFTNNKCYGLQKLWEFT